MLKGVESTPTTQKTDLLDDDTSQRRSLSSEHGSLAQKHLHFFESGSERLTEQVTALNECYMQEKCPAKCGSLCLVVNMWLDGVR